MYINQRQGTTSSLNASFIVTKSGSPAKLWSGKTIVDPTWLYFNKKYPERVYYGTAEGNYIKLTGIFNETKWNQVGTALYVNPRYIGNDMIEVEVYPEISMITGKGRTKAVKVYNLSTKVTVRNGQTIPIGGMISGKKAEYLNIFGPDFFKSGGVGEAVSTTLRATIMKPGSGLRSRSNWIPR
ncbi:MAG: type II and III secretion system protein [Lentisphaerae bacterium]|nr:type II and III secretion system protein [Lentisphaerota bacterium]MCP4102783.1 type II and III secretion system protein [Lentisphaerota bacterium]